MSRSPTATKKLFSAAELGNIESFQEAIDQGADVDYVENGNTVFHMAAKSGNLAICLALYHRGVSFQSCDAKLRTPLIVAAMNNHTAVCNFLLDHNACITNDVEGNSALSYAAKHGNYELCYKLLHNHKAQNIINTPETNSLNTPLHLTIINGKLQRPEEQGIYKRVCTLLITFEADLKKRNVDNKTPRELAKGTAFELLIPEEQTSTLSELIGQHQKAAAPASSTRPKSADSLREPISFQQN